MHGGLRLEIDGVHVDYYPYSIWPRETFTADVDGAYRGAFCQEYSIEELRSEKAVMEVIFLAILLNILMAKPLMLKHIKTLLINGGNISENNFATRNRNYTKNN